jgi:inner membrane protein
MDTVTHALTGYALARTGLAGDTGRWGVIAGVAAALLPDVDGVFGLIFGTEFMLKYHRGLTNSIFTIVPIAAVFAWVFVRLSGIRAFRTFFAIAVVQIAVHTFLDLVTSYGTMILSPFSRHRFALDWVFIVDLYFTAIFVLALLTTLFLRRQNRSVARIAVLAGALYVALCGGSHFWALSVAEQDAKRFDAVERVASLPQPLSPFHWADFIETKTVIYEGYVNLIGDRPRIGRANDGWWARLWKRYQPPDRMNYRSWQRLADSPWVKRALQIKGTETFLWFARFPVARYRRNAQGLHQVTFFDLRFDTLDGRRPFVYRVVFDRDGEVVTQGFERNL